MVKDINMITRDDAHKLTQETLLKAFDITPELNSIYTEIERAAKLGKFSVNANIYDFTYLSAKDRQHKLDQIIATVRGLGYKITIAPKPRPNPFDIGSSFHKFEDHDEVLQTEQPAKHVELVTLIIDWK